MTRISHQMQKQKFGITCPDMLFTETVLTHTIMKHNASLFSGPGRTGMHYATSRSHQMQKHKFSVTYPSILFKETTPVPPEYEK
jgi:hypothetical protein